MGPATQPHVFLKQNKLEMGKEYDSQILSNQI